MKYKFQVGGGKHGAEQKGFTLQKKTSINSRFYFTKKTSINSRFTFKMLMNTGQKA